ncbi:hypothetical protein ZWY2020_039133, partial [Hordeum vulgare]
IDTIHVIISIGFPNLLKKKGAIEELEKDLQKEINSVNQRFNISIGKVKACLFYYNYNKPYMEMPAKEKIILIVSQPISIFTKKKQEFSSFLLTLRKKNIPKMELAI